MPTHPPEKTLADHLTDIEKDLAALTALSSLYRRLFRDNDWPENYLIETMCDRTENLHASICKAWPLIQNNHTGRTKSRRFASITGRQ